MDIVNIVDTKNEIIKRFASGKFSFSEYKSVVTLFQNEAHFDDIKKCLEEDWNTIDNDETNREKLDLILDRMHHKINLDTSLKPNSFQRFYLKVSKVAAILLIPALITIAVLSYLTLRDRNIVNSWVEIHAPVGTRTKFQLPDGSQGWLNSGSSLQYPVNFMADRSVKISGEAWFDIVHLASKDFRVATPNFTVKVLGTQFNVVAYANEPTEEVILERGKVQVLGEGRNVESELIPDQHFIYNKATREYSKTRIDSKSYSSWKDGLLIFKNVPMSEIAKRLERRYGVEIILHGDELKSSIFRATFGDESLDEICKMISEVSNVEYVIHQRKIQPDSSFTKREVEMWLRIK
ncbi:MAG: FecR domain-containing protein [Prolixibacteraceae bacterium]|jgi:ferric-dicitrate binding protein FerR (iron transport regulator)